MRSWSTSLSAAPDESAEVAPDTEVCYCYHVTLRKLANFARRERPTQAARMSECLGAGTGCGWCIPVLTQIADTAGGGPFTLLRLTPAEYAERRRAYILEQRPRNQFQDHPPPSGAAGAV